MPVIGGINLDLALKLLYTKTPDDILEFYQMPYPLTDQQIEKYQQDGFVYLPEMVGQRVLATCSALLRRLFWFANIRTHAKPWQDQVF